MATVTLFPQLKTFEVVPGQPGPTPYVDVSNGNGNVASVVPFYTLSFPDNQTTSCTFQLQTLAIGVTPIWTVAVDWISYTETTGNCVWGAQLAGFISGSTTPFLTKAFAGTSSNTGTVNGTLSAKQRTAFNPPADTLTNTSNSVFYLKIFRNGASLNDTMSGDARLIGITVQYADT